MFLGDPRPSCMQEAAYLATILLDVEANIPREILPVSWGKFRQAWLYDTAISKTIKEVAHALLDLEDGVRILNDRGTQSLKDHAAWRKTVSGIHTYDLLAKYVKLFKLDVQHIVMNSMSNTSTGRIHPDHGLEKRKYFSDIRPTGNPQKPDGFHSSFRHDTCTNSGQSETRPVTLEGLPLSSKCQDKQIDAESVYIIGQEFLPPDAPSTLKFMRAVLVAEKTRFNVTVKFPSVTSLQSYFGRAPEVMANDRFRGTEKLSLALNHASPHARKETCMGTKPELDGHYNMTPKLAESVLVRKVSCTEYLHQGHLWSFWVVEDFEEAHSKRLPADKEAVNGHDLEDDAKGELKAAEALTQLIPGNALIITPEGNRAVHETSGKFCTEGPLRSQIRWGIRSLRRASFGNRSGSGSSPNSCDTGTKDANKDTRKTFSRKILDFSDEQHHNIGQSTKSSNLLQTERLGRTHPRREEKLVDLVAVKCPGTSGKSGNSKHIRSNTILKLPKDMKGRWASERYKSAQLKLIEIMHKRGAVPGKPILRPALREEARKDIGDTGLLDHLLKHMTDTVVTNGERFRRRHNAEGAMEYWLEDASLMEIRKAAGIEDPSWIPPPGWKPGDALPGRGECGYGCWNRRMTPVEAAEMKKLKEMVDTVRSDLRTLTSRAWRLSREVTPEQTKGHKRETTTENEHAQKQSNSEFQEERGNDVQDGKSTCKILPQARSQLETDLSEVQRSVTLMQVYIKRTMDELGFSTEKDHVEPHSNEVNNNGAIESRPVNARSFGAHDAAWVPVGPPVFDLDSGGVLAKTSANADMNHWICSKESDRSEPEDVDFAISVGNEPKRPRLLQSRTGHNSGSQNALKACHPSASGHIVQPGMIVSYTGARDVWAEQVLETETLQADANTSSCIGQKAETSREDASARVIQSITGSDNESQFRPYFQHRINIFSQSADTEVDRNNQIAVYPDHHGFERQKIKRAAGSEGRDYQAPGFQCQPSFQSAPTALADVELDAAQSRDGLAILSFAADAEAISKTAEEQFQGQDIQGVSQNQATLKYSSSPAAGPSREQSPAVTQVYPEVRKRRILNQLSMPYSGCDTGGNLPRRSLPAAKCAMVPGSFQTSVASGPFDETRPKSIPNSRPDSVSEDPETPTAHIAKDPSINLSLNSRMRPGPSKNGFTCNSLKSLRGSVAEPSSTLTLSRLPALAAGGSYGHLHSSLNSADYLESLHSLDQPEALSKKSISAGVRSAMQKSISEIVSEKCSTQSSTSKARSSTWLGLAPPTSTNLHS